MLVNETMTLTQDRILILNATIVFKLNIISFIYFCRRFPDVHQASNVRLEA